MYQEATVSVATSAAVASAPINIITNEVIRPASLPNGSILRGLLEKDTPSEEAVVSSAGDLKLNLLEGLGNDFLDEPMDAQVIARIIEEITPAENATNDSELLGQDIHAGLHEEEHHKEEQITAPSQAPPVSPTPLSHQTSSISSPGTMPNSAIEILQPVSPGGKRKQTGSGGKGAKIFKRSDEEESQAELLSQPEHTVLMRDFQNLIAQVEEQKRLCEERKRESEKKLTSLSSRREEVEERHKSNRRHLHRLLDQFEKLQKTIREQREKCREDEDLLMSLFGEEAQLMAEQDSHQEKLYWYQKRLLALRAAAGGN